VLILTGLFEHWATAVEASSVVACNYLCKPPMPMTVLAALLSRHADLDTLVPENPNVGWTRLQWEHIQRVLVEHDAISPPPPARWACHRTYPAERKCRNAL